MKNQTNGDVETSLFQNEFVGMLTPNDCLVIAYKYTNIKTETI